MALVQGLYQIRATYSDHAARTFVKTWDVAAVDHATAVTYAGTILSAFDALTSAARVGYSVASVWEEDAVTASANVDSNRSDKVIVTGRLETPGKYATFQIPSPAYGTVTQATSGDLKYNVDLGAAELETFVDLYRSPGYLTISDGESFAAAPTLTAGRWMSVKSNG